MKEILFAWAFAVAILAPMQVMITETIGWRWWMDSVFILLLIPLYFVGIGLQSPREVRR